ncbi:carnitine O-palmitoyltransferase 1, liver isoform-like isoform X2 [Oscarella lobularis]|uniref:carnitine O-palmitoyltransferase 1, liver isoform-like isoform X2 n=1 Tax=Oscarella lobularis TaxID=121494 RepID=UPI003314056B
MAEARLAVAFQFAVTDEGVDIQLDKNALRAVVDAAFRSYKRRLARIRALLSRSFFPTTGYTLLAFIIAGLIGCWIRLDPLNVRSDLERVGAATPLLNRFDPFVQEAFLNVVAAGIIWLIFAFVRRRILRLLLGYHGWMFERKPSISTKIWGLCVKVLSGPLPFTPALYSFQGSLPYLPLPSLNDTCSRYLQSVRPLLSGDDYQEMQSFVWKFQNGVGRKLQRYLYLKYLRSQNYVTDWWEQFVYLRSRSSLMINSNYYGMDAMFKKMTSLQAARAGSVINAFFVYKRRLETERMDPLMLRGIIPLCSYQYERTFGTTRIPGIEQDVIRHVDPSQSKHIVIYRHGRWYTMSCFARGRLLETCEIEHEIQRILDDDDPSRPVKPGELKLPALTALNRDKWGRLYNEHFKSGKNLKAMDTLEKAAFVVFLDDDEMFYSEDDPTQIDRMARSLLHGSGYNRWFDKSFCAIIFKNGKIGLTCEHSWSDAPVIAYMLEHASMEELLPDRFRDDGHCVGEIKCGPLKFPERLDWDLNDELVEAIEEAADDSTRRANNVDLRLMVHNEFGKKAITSRCKVGPDGFIQMALQLAYFRDQGHSCLTYEASMTRLFREGRTETVRPVTMQSAAFVKAMCDSASSKEEKRKLLRAACENHQNLAKNCMIGEGVDRHLFCLYIVSKAFKVESPFLQKVLSEPWRLSTSQTPHSQTGKLNEKKFPDQVSFGGGFGPVADDGYGVSYIIAGDVVIFFHVSSFTDSKVTDAYRFADQIRDCMAEMLALFDD